MKKDSHLGDFAIQFESFSDLDKIFEQFYNKDFKALNELQKGDCVSVELLDLIRKAKEPTFLLVAVIDYIDRVNREKLLEYYNFSTFELWLNQFSGLTLSENLHIRAKIVGKSIPRDSYQLIFPVGMNKYYPGSHFVTAHSSPDLDTTIASFWGWVDSFGAKVAEGLHVWNVPGGPNLSQVEFSLLFQDIFGEGIFSHVVKMRSTLAVSSIDLMSQKGVVRKEPGETSLAIDLQRDQNAIILVDNQGYYLGDWRHFDAEGVRQVIMLLNNCLIWFENNLHVKLISLFAKEQLNKGDIPGFIRSVLAVRIIDCEPAKEFTEKQKKHVEDYLVKVLGINKGLQSTFEEFAVGLNALSISDFQLFVQLIESLEKSALFDKSGKLIENRPQIFHKLEEIIEKLELAIQSVRSYVERLDVALDIKTQVFGYLPQVISYRADVEEIRNKMGPYPYLTVTYADKEGRMLPVGVIHAGDLHRPVLGTVTLRDFCNREETKIPSYLEIISVIDHHKSIFSSISPPVIHISDAQSSNVLLAEIAFTMNDQFSTAGMTAEEIEAQIAVEKDKRVLKRLLQRLIVAERGPQFYIDHAREFIEYFQFLYAILDDTDLLTKVTLRDVECVANLLNRLKSLSLKKEVQIVSFDDIPKDQNFVQRAADRIVQNHDMYSLYRKIYLAKERAAEHNLVLCAKGQPSSIFLDTKEQNGCCRVGQTKLFVRNIPTFFDHATLIRKMWYEEAARFYQEKPEVDLHLHMISTIAGAEDLFAGTGGNYAHKDELWIWIPDSEQATEHLKSFLNAFSMSPQVISNDMEVEFLGDNAKELDRIFMESFMPIPRKVIAEKGSQSLPIAVLRFNAGSINSRKAMITPYLPRLVT